MRRWRGDGRRGGRRGGGGNGRASSVDEELLGRSHGRPGRAHRGAVARVSESGLVLVAPVPAPVLAEESSALAEEERAGLDSGAGSGKSGVRDALAEEDWRSARGQGGVGQLQGRRVSV